jgi:TPR repeat protein
MNRTFKAAIAALIFAVGFAGSVAAGPREDVAAALAAYKKDDYVTALRLLRPRAEQGYPEAQYNLGAMYELGQGVLQDHAVALNWSRQLSRATSWPKSISGTCTTSAGSSHRTTRLR